MLLVNYSSELIQQIYQREEVEDVAQWRDAVKYAASSRDRYAETSTTRKRE